MKALFLHPGLGPGERHYLNQAGTIADIQRDPTILKDGACVSFWDFDEGDNGPDRLLFSGTLHFDPDLSQWYALIDWNSFRHESEERAD